MKSAIVDESTMTEPTGPESEEGLRGVIIYETIEDGKRAMQLLCDITGKATQQSRVQPVPWSFSSLSNRSWNQMAVDDAIKADILVIAAQGRIPVGILDWIIQVMERKAGTAAAIVALRTGRAIDCGTEADWSEIESAVVKAGLTYFSSIEDPSGKYPKSTFGGSEWAVCAE